MEFSFRKKPSFFQLSTRISRVVTTHFLGISSNPKSQAITKTGTWCWMANKRGSANRGLSERDFPLLCPIPTKFHVLPPWLVIHSTPLMATWKRASSANSRKCSSSGSALSNVSNEGSYSALAFCHKSLWLSLRRNGSNTSSFSWREQRCLAWFAWSSWIFPFTIQASHLSGVEKWQELYGLNAKDSINFA